MSENTNEEWLADKVGANFRKLPAFRMRLITQRYDTKLSDIMKDEVLGLIVLAHEWWKHDSGSTRDNWDKFENMTLDELNEFIGISDEYLEAGSVDDSKSGDSSE